MRPFLAMNRIQWFGLPSKLLYLNSELVEGIWKVRSERKPNHWRPPVFPPNTTAHLPASRTKMDDVFGNSVIDKKKKMSIPPFLIMISYARSNKFNKVPRESSGSASSRSVPSNLEALKVRAVEAVEPKILNTRSLVDLRRPK